MNTKEKGEMSEGMILALLLRLGYSVSIPFGGSQKYDLILDRGGELVRVQVKTGNLKNGCIHFPTSARNTINGKRTSYHTRADLLLVYCPELDKVYAVPIDEQTNASAMQLRVDPLSKRGPKSTARWATDYEFPDPYVARHPSPG